MLPDLRLPSGPLYIIYRLKKAGYEAFLVGGAVRDSLGNALGFYQTAKTIDADDFDFTTNATPEQIMAVFPQSFYKNTFGTVSVTPHDLRQLMGLPPQPVAPAVPVAAGRIDITAATRLHESLDLPTHPREPQEPKNYEITTYRVGETYTNDSHRRPQSWQWGTSISDDLSRRDFTINALALTINLPLLEKFFGHVPDDTYPLRATDYTLIDDFAGLTDLQDNLVQAIGDPDERFREDALRLMRAVRLSVQLNFAIEDHTYQALKRQADLLQSISGERIRDEFFKILASDYPKEGVMLLDETGLLTYIVPELLAAKGVAQSGHHLTDVWVHSLDALANCPSIDPLVRLASLLHDVGKPATQEMIDGQYTFYNHQNVGAKMVRHIAHRLKLSRADTDRLTTLVRHHMFHYQPTDTDAAIRRFMRQVGLDNLNDILDVREADRLGSNARKTSWRLEEMKQRMIAQLHQPMQVRDLAIGGHELMDHFHLSPGPILGEVLQALLERVLDDATLNTPEQLLAIASDLLRSRPDGGTSAPAARA